MKQQAWRWWAAVLLGLFCGSNVAADQPAPIPDMVLLPAGDLQLGSSRDDYEHNVDSGETPALAVKIRRAFWIGRFEVTRAEWAAFVATGPQQLSAQAGCQTASQAPAAPMTCISLADIEAYLRWLTTTTGQRYRLPSEAEWEYAARAGNRGARFWSNRDSHEGVSISRACDFGNVYDVTGRIEGRGEPHARCSDGYAALAPVGSFQPNNFGLYDTMGNARERVADCFTRSYKGRPADDRAWVWSDCRYHGVRGGSYLTRPLGVRSAARDFIDDRDSGAAPDLGFRVARDAELP